jgi:hypothetical protein
MAEETKNKNRRVRRRTKKDGSVVTTIKNKKKGTTRKRVVTPKGKETADAPKGRKTTTTVTRTGGKGRSTAKTTNAKGRVTAVTKTKKDGTTRTLAKSRIAARNRRATGKGETATAARTKLAEISKKRKEAKQAGQTDVAKSLRKEARAEKKSFFEKMKEKRAARKDK